MSLEQESFGISFILVGFMAVIIATGYLAHEFFADTGGMANLYGAMVYLLWTLVSVIAIMILRVAGVALLGRKDS